MSHYRSDLPPLPAELSHLPLDERGYPLPWFVATVKGRPDPRVADGFKRCGRWPKAAVGSAVARSRRIGRRSSSGRCAW